MPVKSASPLTMYLSLRASRTLLYGHVKKCRYLCTKHTVLVLTILLGSSLFIPRDRRNQIRMDVSSPEDILTGYKAISKRLKVSALCENILSFSSFHTQKLHIR